MKTASAVAPARFVTLDALRGLAAIMVMAYHFTQFNTHGLFKSADMAVDFFFALSGFVLLHAYAGKLAHDMSFARFALQRVIRLYPFYLIGSLVGIAAFVFIWSRGPVPNANTLNFASAVFSTLLFLPNVTYLQSPLANGQMLHYAFPFNDPSWSLFFEMFISLVFGAVLWKFRKLWPVALASLIGLVVCVGLLKGMRFGWSLENLAGGFPRVFLSFSLGMMVYRVSQSRNWNLTVPPLLPMALLFACLALPSLPTTSGLFKLINLGWYLVFICLLSPCLIFMAAHATPLRTLNKVYQWLGDMSYGIYVLHIPVFYMVLTFVYPNPANRPEITPVFLLATLTLCLALVHILTVLVDTPVRAALMRKLKKSSV